MFPRANVWVPLVALLASPAPAFAQSWHRTEIFLASSAQAQNMALLSMGDVEAASRPGVDYALFATELAAYLTKEVLHDSLAEYDGSLLGSHLSRSMPDTNSQFGSHCLTIVTRIGSSFGRSPSPSFAAEPASLAATAARAGAVGLALHQIWSAFKNDVDGDRSGVSLNPKVSSRRVGVNLTLRW